MHTTTNSILQDLGEYGQMPAQYRPVGWELLQLLATILVNVMEPPRHKRIANFGQTVELSLVRRYRSRRRSMLRLCFSFLRPLKRPVPSQSSSRSFGRP